MLFVSKNVQPNFTLSLCNNCKCSGMALYRDTLAVLLFPLKVKAFSI